MDTIFAKALEEVQPGMVVGLGSGRASLAFVRALGERVNQGLVIRGVPTSIATENLARELKIPLVGLDEINAGIDLTVDGADEVDPDLNMIKGYGRALVREKIIASSSKRLIILIGLEKLVNRLGDRGKLPIEVVPFAVPLVSRRFAEMGIQFEFWAKDGKPGLTDNGNRVFDCQTLGLEDIQEFAQKARAIPGVVDTGVFSGMANTVLVGDEAREFAWCQTLERPILENS